MPGEHSPGVLLFFLAPWALARTSLPCPKDASVIWQTGRLWVVAYNALWTTGSLSIGASRYDSLEWREEISVAEKFYQKSLPFYLWRLCVWKGRMGARLARVGLVGAHCLAVQSCPTLCDPVDCSAPGFPVLHYLPELAQIHVRQIGDVSQSPPLLPSSSSPLAFNFS